MLKKIRMNAPVTLFFSLTGVTVLAVDNYVFDQFIEIFFTCSSRSGFSWREYEHYFRLVTHIVGHSGWDHLSANAILILVLGPILEEKYGSLPLFMMILVTAFLNGLINVLFIDYQLYGSSSIVFMMILLSSVVNIQSGEIPLTLILVVFFYLGAELMSMIRSEESNISHLSHLIGGFCGSIFGYRIGPGRKA